MFKAIIPAIAAATLLAAPAGAVANPASALSLSADVRSGETIDGQSALTGLPLGTWVSVALSLVAAYLAIDALSDDEPVSA